MRRLWLVAVLSLALSGLARPAMADGGIDWYQEFTLASTDAVRDGRMIVIDFWADWCIPCRVMDAEVYSRPRVRGLFRERVVALRVNADLQKDLVRRFAVSGLPFLVFTTSYGTPLVSHAGTMTERQLVDVVNAIPAMASLNALDRRVRETKGSTEALLAFARELRASAFFAASNVFYGQAAGRRDAKGEAGTIALAMGLNHIDLRDGKSAVNVLKKAVSGVVSPDLRPALLLELGRAHRLAGNEDRAARQWRSIVEEYPESDAARTARALLENP